MENQVKRGRPRGVFDYHKLRLLYFLQSNTPYMKNMNELKSDLSSMEDPVDVSERQLSRYLSQLERELTPEGKSRVSVVKMFVHGVNGGARQRVVICNDKRLLQF